MKFSNLNLVWNDVTNPHQDFNEVLGCSKLELVFHSQSQVIPSHLISFSKNGASPILHWILNHIYIKTKSDQVSPEHVLEPKEKQMRNNTSYLF